jgi:hypothetical protein
MSRPQPTRTAAAGKAANVARAARSPGAGRVERLSGGCEREALRFLGARPLHTIIMAGMIRDNGCESELNRGSFHAFRDARGRLQGVALLGHLTVFEARTEEALAAFARRARSVGETRLILGESETVGRFWSEFDPAGRVPRKLRREYLLELRHDPPGLRCAPVPSLRPAVPADLERVSAAHAEMARGASGVDPLEVDREGFNARTLRRIERGRVWVWTEGGRLVFKADAVADTPEVVYLEGLYVHPRERGKGYGLRCLSQLGRSLLARSASVCLLVEAGNGAALSLSRRAGYEPRADYDTIFLGPRDPA